MVVQSCCWVLSWPSCSGDGERAVPGSAWLVCQGLTTAGGFKESRVKWVTVGRERTALGFIQQGGALLLEVPSSSWPGKVLPSLPVQDTVLCCHPRSKGTKGVSPACSAELPAPFLCPPRPHLCLSGGSQHPWTHQTAEVQTTQLSAETRFKYKRSAFPPLVRPACFPVLQGRGWVISLALIGRCAGCLCTVTGLGQELCVLQRGGEGHRDVSPLVTALAESQAPARRVTTRMCPGCQPVRSVLITNASSLAASANWEARQDVRVSLPCIPAWGRSMGLALGHGAGHD